MSGQQVHQRKPDGSAGTSGEANAIPAGPGGPGTPEVDNDDAVVELTLPLAAHVPAMPPLGQTRVGKSLRAGAAGTVKLMQRFGPSLLLVRYRYDWTGLYRYTTVELLVDAMPVTRGRRPSATFAVRLNRWEQGLRRAAVRLGGEWDPQLRAWLLPGSAVQSLGLGPRVELMRVDENPTPDQSRPAGDRRSKRHPES